MRLRLNGPEILRLTRLLRQAFPPASFDELLLALDRDILDFQGTGVTHPTVVLNAAREANAKLWWRDLLREASNAVPADPDLKAFAEEFGFSAKCVDFDGDNSAPLRGRQLELKIRALQTTFDIVSWRVRLAEIEARVCRVEYPAKQGQGTGFLIGPNAVLTNYHVIEPILEGAILPKDVRVRFDYKVLDDGVAVGAGKPVSLAQNWLYDSSPYSPEDFKTKPDADPDPDQLDYAILRLGASPGDEPPADGGNRRGWIAPVKEPHDFMAQRALYIVQHPDAKPMQVAIDSEAVLRVNGNGTRVQYTTTTEPGSSGSPCFGANWGWVALHHGGDPKYYKGQKPEFNQGIPVTAIWRLVKERGKDTAFGKAV